jgi:hypothetical protein
MLYISLVLSTILWLVAYRSIRHPERWPVAFLICGVGFSLGPAFLAYGFFPPVAMLFVFLLPCFLIFYVAGRKQWLFLLLSTVATGAAFGISTWSALEEQRAFAQLREKFPYESMENRAPAPRHTIPVEQLPESTAQRLTQQESTLGDTTFTFRAYYLRQLHENTVGLFTSSPGFGAMRVFRIRPSEEYFVSKQRPEHPISQPAPRQAASPGLPNEVKWEPRARQENLYQMHLNSIFDFANPNGFGFIKDRRHVVGFQAHEFSEVPRPIERWTVQTLDLVGLLMHDEPVAYVSAHLPRMDELREAPIRPLDGFEVSGLDQLRRGEDLVLGDTAKGTRMLGAIRSTKLCVECHGGERGDLLGAFSYTLRRAER